MFRRYRLPAIALGLILSGAAISQPSDQKIKQQPAPPEVQQQQTVKPLPVVQVVPSAVSSEPDTKEPEPKEQEHPDYKVWGDTWPQWIMAGAAILGIGIAIATLELVRRTLKATQAAAEYARRAAVATEAAINGAEIAAAAAVRAANATVGAERDRIRPNHIFLHDAGVRPNPSANHILQLDHISFVFKNGGKSAADITAISVNRIVSNTLPDKPVYGVARPVSPTHSIEAGGIWTYTSWGWDRTDDHIDEKFADRILAGEVGDYWVYGYVEYFNFVGDKEELKFCAWLNANMLACNAQQTSLTICAPKNYS